ncbi:PREDICTED: breast cancer type 2 susceptibility protein-like isoform X1 [Acromyrmex echinatior]|uniref:Breast cancer type 2 susceptibility protein-like protein n=1 Tax=Acromyrmex echinatior TaxID=103372 RepID=F4WV33_ACREC|nr:PREDICTED: breast cancer type 2 susceptibility protein-like isoform X1 [Acromyrmex echinatior]EGI61921.1 Breast cancer type 2 susceptibility protein-like protein [Acromyrmex echinatior]
MDLPETDNAEDDSDELFSDDEQKKEIRHRSNVCQDTSVLSLSETPLSLLDYSPSTIMPTDAVIPSTPLSLLPFLNKINEQWSSDLETPQAQPHMISTINTTEETPKGEQRTPDVSSVKSVEKIISDSPVIASRASRRRSKRRIFKSSISIDPLAVTDNENITANVQVETPVISDDANSVAQDDTTNAAISTSSLETTLKDDKPKVLDKSQDTCNDEELKNVTNDVPDSLNTSTQEFFNNVSFSKIDELCLDTFNNQKTIETTVTQCNYEQNVDKERNIEENENIGFVTARGTSINVSKQALFKAKRLFADMDESTFDMDEMQTKNYESLVKRNKSNEEKDRYLPSSSFVSVNIAKEALPKPKPFIEQLKNYDNVYTADCKKPLESKSSSEEVNKAPILLSTASGNPINISKKALLKAKALLADESHNINDDELIKYYERSTDKKSTTIKIKTLPSFSATSSKSISGESPIKARTLFAEHLDDTVEVVVAEETNAHNKETKGLEIKMSNIKFKSPGSAVGISEQISKAKIFDKRLDDQVEPVIANKVNKINEIENMQEVKIPSIGFQTAGGTYINISERALSKAKALFADELDCPLEMDIVKNSDRDEEKIKKRDLAIPYGGLQTASDQEVPVSNNAALTARELFSNDCLDESNPDLGRASLQKRKLSETNVDGSTPQGRNYTSETKRARLSSEFQARKLFFDNTSTRTDNDENRDPDKKRQTSSVVESTSGSPKTDSIESTESEVAGSPIIGRQSSLRKRKSLGYQRDESNTSRADNKMLDNENAALQENVVQGSATCGKIEDDKLNTEESTQATQEKAKGNSMGLSEYGDTQMMMDFIDQSTKVLQDRLAAALEQEAIITAKRRRAQSEGSKQSMGHLYRYKQINSNARLSMRQIGGGAPPIPCSYQELIDRRISPRILEITAATAATYKFRCSDFYGDDVAHRNVRGIEMEDDVRLILDENGYAGIWEFLRAFLASSGVDPNLIPARWVENHYRWIVWKLASMDRMKFGSVKLPRALTPSYVMAQLKYRYDREIDRSQRPAIRRILEKDDVPSKRMTLCVSSIIENNNVSMEIGKSPRVGVPKWRIELTDGWYSTNACIDIGMVKNISTGKIREGTKLLLSGAELLNCDQGFYPLEAPADVCLKLHTNSTRRARWDTKLGYAPRSGPIPIKLRNVCPSGGLIGKMTIVVARVYPMLYYEKTASGDSIVRNAKSEEKAQNKYEQQCWSKIESFYAQAEDFQGKELSGETDDMAIQLSEDYENLSTEESVSKKRHDELLQELRQKEERFKQRMQSKLRESLPGPRQVSQLLKVRVCDENANAILSVWSPSEEIVDALKEGACVSLCNIVASGKRGTELQLTARRSAIFKPGRMRDASYPARVCTSLDEIANSEFVPPYGEFDTVGLVCSVGPAPYGMRDFDAVHLAYCKTGSSESSYLSILFWQGIASYGYTEILTVGSIVACSNLEWRRATSWNVPAAYCTDRSTFTRNPRRNHLYESFENLRNLIMDPVKYAESCTFELNVELQKKSTPTRYSASKNTPIKMYSSTSNADKKLVDYMSPLATPKLGVDNRSSVILSNPSIKKRLEKLQQYGEAPQLSPIILRNSKRICLDFRSPILPISDVNSTKETTNANQPEELKSSTSEKHS